MDERMEEAGAFDEPLTVKGRQLHAGDPAPDFRLDYLDLADLVVRTICLADSSGSVRLLNVVNSLVLAGFVEMPFQNAGSSRETLSRPRGGASRQKPKERYTEGAETSIPAPAQPF